MKRRLLSLCALLLAAVQSLSMAGDAGAAPRLTLNQQAAVTRAGTDQATAPKDGQRRSGAARTMAPGTLVSVVVKLDVAPLASYQGGVAGLPATSPRATGKKLDPQSAESRRYLAHVEQKQREFEARARGRVPQARLTERYGVVLGGVAMQAPPDRLADLAALPGVTGVYPDSRLQLHTERSPAFIGAPRLWQELGGRAEAGEGVIVGVLDSGVWPEHPSFADPGPRGNAYPAPPPPVSGTRACEFSGGANPGPAFACNNKLIGADRFMATYDAVIGLLPTEFTTARDDNGHGTHTASTAAGNGGVVADIFDLERGVISGIAPRAHVIAYKVCGDEGCFQSDSVAAIQKAILDGVDAINFSISGGANPYSDAVELAFLDAYAAGVFVAASAGNAGPGSDTVDHRGPWVTTVGASTTDRHFLSDVALIAAGGASLTLTGATVTRGIATPTDVVNAASAPINDPLCLNATPDGSFVGKIVICQRGGGIARIEKSYNVAQRGAAGLLLYNLTPQGLNTDNHFVPSLHLENDAGARLVAFLNSHSGVRATFPAGAAREVRGDVMAPFSSRGGPAQALGISKPDLTAPGVQILAGHTPAPATPGGGPPGELFQSIQGTSMSSPHVAGAAALLKDLHPDWTPGQIKSALMTTARTRVVKEGGETPTTPFDDGSGRVNLARAFEPGLTFDVPATDYVAFADQLFRVNYPSLYVPSMPGRVTVQRTARNVDPFHAGWAMQVIGKSHPDFQVSLSIPHLNLPPGGAGAFDVTIDARNVPLGQTRFAAIRFAKGDRELHFPIAFVRGRAAVTLDKTCAPAVFARGADTTCTLTVANTTFVDANIRLTDRLPNRLRLTPGSPTGGATQDGNGIAFTGVVPASRPPNVMIGAGSSPGGGYLPLSGFGVAPIGGVGDETIVNFNVPAFPYGGETYTQIGIVSNGYAVVGGGTGADVDFINQVLPSPVRPNNVLAPFWTDLNPAAGGALRIATLTDGADTWIVLDWEGVREFSLARTSSFQIWIGINGDAHPGEDISFAFGAIGGSGDLGFLTVGAENKFGNRGQNHYVDGVGTLPVNGAQLRVTTTPGAPSTKVITFQARGQSVGPWTNFAEMTSDLTFGTSIARFSGQVTPP